MRYLATFLAVFFIPMIGTSAFADIPEILQISEIKSGTEAIGFSVFKGVEPQPFNVQLGEVTNVEGFNLILARISGGPMETPLEKIGAIAGMSGSPVFIDCTEYSECLQKGTLVGALSHSLGYFVEGGPNAGLTPAEYMLGAHFGGYTAANQFSVRPPNKINVGGREFRDLLLFPGFNDSLMQGMPANGNCNGSFKSEIKPGSMVTVFLARGSRDVGASGTVFWRDGDKIYIFGHPFFGTGAINYPFVHVSVADTLQTPFEAAKIIGCRLETEGTMLMDGAYEVGGIIGQTSRVVPFKVELHLGDNLVVFDEEIAASPLAAAIINILPVLWAQQILGDMSYMPVVYQIRIKVTDEPEIFLNSLIPAQMRINPFGETLARVNAVFDKLRDSGFDYNLENIMAHVDFVRDVSVWTAKKSFLSHDKVMPGDMVYVNIVLEERSSGSLRQVSIPVTVPKDFKDRITPKISPQFSIVVQSSDKFIDKSVPAKPASLRDVVYEINESSSRKTNVLYVQQIMPLTKAERETAEENAKLSVRPAWQWTELDQGAIRRLPGDGNQEILLTATPELDHFISFDATLTVNVNVLENPSDSSSKNESKKWSDILKPWKWF